MRSGFAFLLSSLLLMAAPTHAQRKGTDESPPTSAERDDEILVVGDRPGEAEAVRNLTASITKREARDKPLPRFYMPFCPRVLGVQADYATELTRRLKANASESGVVVARNKCQPNALLILTRDAPKMLKTLRREQSWLFTDMSETAFKRLVESSEQVSAWQVSEIRGADGKPMRTIEVEIGMPPVKTTLTVNDQWQASRLSQPVRVDVSGAVVLVDSRYLPGKTLTQLADYASMRLLASTNDVEGKDAAAVPTILSLFATPGDAPLELTPFDMGYLRARYSVRPNVNALAIKDAAVKAYFAETDK